jgi:hypothetical protein
MVVSDRRVVAVLVVLVASLAGSGVAAAGGTAQSGEMITVTLTQEYERVPETPGEVEVTLRYEFPDQVTEFTATVPEKTRTAGTNGFSQQNATRYEWNGDTSPATITLRFDPNETTQQTGIEAADGQYLFVDVGEWALFRRIATGWGASYTGTSADQVKVDRSIMTTGPGATGEQLIYLGEVERTTRRAHDQTFRLIVPKRASLAESRSDILDSLSAASDSLRVRDRDERVIAFVAPTERIEWGVRGLESGGSEFWVRDSEELDTASNVWLHEYVHTRQAFSTRTQTRWLTEGTAVYYAALLTLEQDRISFEEFAGLLERGGRSSYDDVILSDPDTWVRNANYVKGPLGTGRIDESIRSETNATATAQGVMRQLNTHDGKISQQTFLTAVRDAGGSSAESVAKETSETATPLSMWDKQTHTRLFGTVPAQITYLLPERVSGYSIDGPYRNGTIPTLPIRLATGERLTVESIVRNTGGASGSYNATLQVNGTTVETKSGTIDPGEEVTVPLAETFETPGRYELSVGGERSQTVIVEPPAEPVVTSVRVESATVRQGNTTLVTATVENDATIPANGTITFTRNGESVAREPVRLLPGTTQQISASIQFPTAGEVRIGAGSAEPVTVTVTEPPVLVDGGEIGDRISDAAGPGFTPGITLVAVVIGLCIGVVRRRCREA